MSLIYLLLSVAALVALLLFVVVLSSVDRCERHLEVTALAVIAMSREQNAITEDVLVRAGEVREGSAARSQVIEMTAIGVRVARSNESRQI